MTTIVDGSNGITFPNSSVQAAAVGSRTFTTTGAVSAAGLPVALNSDGTVSTVANITGTSTSAATGVANPTTSERQNFHIAYSPTSNVYLATYYNNTAGQCYVFAGTLSGTTFTWGTAVQVPSSTGNDISVAWVSTSDVFVVTYIATGGSMAARVITVSGTTPTVNAVSTVSSDTNTGATGVVFDSTSGSLVAFRVSNTSTVQLWYAHGGTISGATLTWDTTGVQIFTGATQVSPAAYSYIGIAAGGSIVFASVDSNDTGIFVMPLSVSGTTVTKYTQVSFSLAASSTTKITLVYNSLYGVWMLAYASSNAILTTLFTVSSNVLIPLYGVGTTAWTTQTGITVSGTIRISSVYDSTANKIVFSTSGTGVCKVSFGQIINQGVSLLTFSPTAVTVDSSSNAIVTQGNMTYSSGAGKVVGLTIVSGAISLNAFNLTSAYSTNSNAIGVSTASASGGASLVVTTVGGVNTGVTGLTTGSNYFASTTGTLTTNPTGAKLIGRALSATALLVTEGTVF